ncbi:MAG: glutamate synthase large subunit [Bacteroidaceae bacterium]|nr:glutamate synthase large subunit [Bacteroidaceae bacterium]MBO7111631.1 glutamate synthase large subunit [Bacteroidaceae bacterium]
MIKTRGLYDPQNEHDACGIGMMVDLKGNKTHELVDSSLTVLENMKHRGAEAADNKSGDGAGILLQIPHEFILLQGIPVPERLKYGTGLVFLPKDKKLKESYLDIIREEVTRMGLQLTHVREVPVNSNILGDAARATEPFTAQIFVTGSPEQEGLETLLYKVRKHVEQRISDGDFYIVSLSSRIMVYKGMLTSTQLREYYPDLSSPFFTSAIAMVHSRFSTNTFPTWSLAQPFRMLAHNGEINTIRGNRGWMEARESVLSSEVLGPVSDIHPIVQPGMSDSASFDNALEFFVRSGMSLPHAMAMMIPESFNEKNPISSKLKAFYEYHSILMEPWDGPAAMLFTDGRYAGGMLDRNGLRPARYLITDDGKLIMASETGTIHVDAAKVIEKGKLQPGKILLVDTDNGTIIRNDEIKNMLASECPYGEWLSEGRVELAKLKSGRKAEDAVPDFKRRLRAFDYTREDIDRVIVPMCQTAQEPLSSMGNDTQLAVLSDRPQLLFNYFRQQFAQVTNPPIDPIREELVMSLTEYIGAVGMNILTPSEGHCKMVRLPQPVLTNTELDTLRNIRYKGFNTEVLPILFEKSKGAKGMADAIEDLCHQAEKSVEAGINYIILSDRGIDDTHAAIPSLLAVSAIHHYLVSIQKRVQTALIVESGEIREVMHVALLMGYGASAVNPYMAFAVIDDLVKKGELQLDVETARHNYIKAVDKGLKKILSKMGISTIRSYRGAKIFESIGLSQELLSKYFGTASSTIGGVTLEGIARDAERMHAQGFSSDEPADVLPFIGQYAFRKDGIRHAWTPEAISTLQLATRLGSYKKFQEFCSIIDDKKDPLFLRDFFKFKTNPIPVDQVEPASNIVKRFIGAAMSFGAISKEAHEAIAIALNTLESRSNTGEGGEDSERFHTDVDGVSLSSKIKQVASGRFGVTAEYLVNAKEIQIKIAQGAKPGEGGQLPGFKVNEIIARTRNSIAGISLISPPPHHDIYSIEDLAQLIFDLKNVNPEAKISVKLVAESGVGTIAAGVAKAKADLVVISGSEGGTGASPASSIRYAGVSPEIGLSETQQTLVLNDLRKEIEVQVDGQLKTPRDVISMALLGAGEFGFGTAQLIVLGCLLMRKCHTNACPVGVATQDPALRAKFRGHSQYLINYYNFLAEGVREYLAQLGFTRFEDIIGRTDLIEIDSTKFTEKTSHLDFSKLLTKIDGSLFKTQEQHHLIDDVLDRKMIADSKSVLDNGGKVYLKYDIINTNRSAGAMLSGEVAKRYGHDGLEDGSINVEFKGSAGQSFGAFLMKGVNFKLEGESNDYVGKGLSGGRIAICPPAETKYEASENIIAGNTILYGATSGEIFINGRVGERFAVRNSGATAVVEGTGDHCCEYMTGGRVVVLGTTGRNFAAGMSGGLAYVWDKNHDFDYYCNMDMIELDLIEDKVGRDELHSLIEKHYKYTGSALAKKMLDNWSQYVGEFIQVTPIEYRRILQEERMKALQQKIDSVQRDY